MQPLQLMPTLTPSPTPTPLLPTYTPIPSAESRQEITLWLPHRFAPDTPPGSMLKEHLALFEENHPNVTIHVRIKDDRGDAGILETLVAASTVAPSTLPDIIALDPAALRSAAIKNLIQPLDGLLSPPIAPDWYSYAVLAAYVDDQFYAVPFISEVQAFAYRKDDFEEEPRSWTQLVDSKRTFLFPAGDPDGIFTLIQYQILDGQLEDELDQPTIDINLLSEIFGFYTYAHQNGALPLMALQLENAEESFFTLQQQSFHSAVVPLEGFLNSAQDGLFNLMPWPTRNGSGVIPANTWTWAIVSKDATLQALAVEMIEWLLAPEFLGPWAYSLGSLPATSVAMDEWPDQATAATIRRLIRVAVPAPSADEKITFGPAIQSALIELLNGRKTPDEAAQMILDQISTLE